MLSLSSQDYSNHCANKNWKSECVELHCYNQNIFNAEFCVFCSFYVAHRLLDEYISNPFYDDRWLLTSDHLGLAVFFLFCKNTVTLFCVNDKSLLCHDIVGK